MYNLDQIKKELKAYVNSAPDETTRKGRKYAANQEMGIWMKVCKAQDEKKPFPTGEGLHLERRGLDVLSPTLCKLPPETLDFLDLSENKLEELPESIGNLSALKRLYVTNNSQLTALPESIGNLSALEYLDVNNNQLTALPESIGNLSALKRLDVNNNQLTALSESIGNLSALEYLDVNNNQLTALPESIGNLSVLN